MPVLGMNQETGMIVSWLKQEGETVQKGEVLLEIQTDKATVELEAEASGILQGVTAFAGDEVPVAETIAWIVAEGEQSRGYPVTPVAQRMAQDHGLTLTSVVPSDGKKISKQDVYALLATNQASNQASNQQSNSPKLLPASPLARQLAKEHGLLLAEMSGSGPEGAVLAADVRAVLQVRPAAAPEPKRKPLEMSRIWALTAQRLTTAWQTIPHFYLERDVIVSELVRWRKVAQANSSQKVTYTDLLVKCVAAALRKHPRVNASWQNEQIMGNEQINIGLAVATYEGLVVPVISQADQLSVASIATTRQGIVERAMAGKLNLQDVQGGTFTISNLGMYGVNRFAATMTFDCQVRNFV